MKLLPLLERGLTALREYENTFVSDKSKDLPVTIFREEYLTIEDRRPDTTIYEGKYKVLINGWPTHGATSIPISIIFDLLTVFYNVNFSTEKRST